MSNANKFLLAFIGGTVVGTAIGLIFAPEKGAETRRKIADSVRDFSSGIVGKAEELVERADGSRNARSRYK